MFCHYSFFSSVLSPVCFPIFFFPFLCCGAAIFLIWGLICLPQSCLDLKTYSAKMERPSFFKEVIFVLLIWGLKVGIGGVVGSAVLQAVVLS